MKVVENSPQKHETAPFFLIFFGGACPHTPLAKARCSRHAASRHVYPKSHKFESWAPPPLRNPAYAPVFDTILPLIFY